MKEDNLYPDINNIENIVHRGDVILVTNYLNTKDVSNVINSLASSFFFRHMEGSGDEVLLLVLNLHHLTLDRIVCEELVDEDFLLLSQSMNSVKALPLACRVPCRVKQKQVIC